MLEYFAFGGAELKIAEDFDVAAAREEIYQIMIGRGGRHLRERGGGQNLSLLRRAWADVKQRITKQKPIRGAAPGGKERK